ncbi:MAG: AAA family ATPase [Clostridiales bacterium]|jgi:hypothetical protein|nr:AAA family ATPase [Clostridiales bacterium]
MKKLPVGIQTFREIIDGNYVYADKTQYIYNLLTNGKCYFLSRPRRFGKSLLLDTIAEVFSGDRELFRGLWIYSSDWDFKKYPVIRMDMSLVDSKNENTLTESLNNKLNEYSEVEGFNSVILSSRLQQLIRALHRKYGERVVILIDEYDKPLLDHIIDTETAEANRRVIKSFFGVLKGMDAYLKFVFFTGVSKFTKTSLFSEMNNLLDITLM